MTRIHRRSARGATTMGTSLRVYMCVLSWYSARARASVTRTRGFKTKFAGRRIWRSDGRLRRWPARTLAELSRGSFDGEAAPWAFLVRIISRTPASWVRRPIGCGARSSATRFRRRRRFRPPRRRSLRIRIRTLRVQQRSANAGRDVKHHRPRAIRTWRRARARSRTTHQTAPRARRRFSRTPPREARPIPLRHHACTRDARSISESSQPRPHPP